MTEGLARRRDLQRAQHEVARILAETEHPVEAYMAILEAIATSLGWELGAVWEVDPADGRLRCVRTWYEGTDAGLREFEEISERLVLDPGTGLPGRVVELGEPTWILDAPGDTNFPRAQVARRSGLHAAFGFPLRSAAGTVGVMEFFTREPREPDVELLATMRLLGSQVGQFVARRHAEEEVRAGHSRLRAMLEAAIDAVVTMNHEGCVIGWNHAAERIFGYTSDEAIGQDMGDLIVPPALRDRHRAGIARYIATERPVVLDRRLELTGRHRDGREFPIELAITRIALPGPPTFTGYIRDITEQKRAEAALRASRARLVEVADAERRRIQRNLHDGAQQRLTSVLLSLGRLRKRQGGDEDDPLLDLAIDELAAGLQEIRELARGLHPAVLSERGLAAALEALALRAPVPVEIGGVPDRRLPEQAEAAAYYVVAEALANVHKHAGARRVEVVASETGGVLTIEVADDGVGGAKEEGTGIRGLADRVEALGGELALDSPAGKGTRLVARIPVET